MTKQLMFWLNRICLTAVLLLIVYKIYLNFFERDFVAEHAEQVENIEKILDSKDEFQFAVVGDISNSVGIFERKIIPQLNEKNYDFVISAGNAVLNGGEDKYRAVYRTLSQLKMPYTLTFGPQEESRLGGFRFYDHFGPLYFSFNSANARFLFLDSTGTTDYSWQYRWLKEELAAAKERNVFLFSAHPFYPIKTPNLFSSEDDALIASSVRSQFTSLIEKSNIDAVFSSNYPVYDSQFHNGTRYITTGGAGGFVMNNDQSHYHYVSVTVRENQIIIKEHPLQIGQHSIWRTAESIWFFIHSIFYVSYLNFILLVSAFVVIAYWLHQKVLSNRDYYPNFDDEPEKLPVHSLKVAHFTNNYLPFVGGVPLSVERLRTGLNKLGHQVLIVAPSYPADAEEEKNVLRVGTLVPFGSGSEFRVANIFSLRLYRKLIEFKPDIIHVHHPFWLGCVGLYLARYLGVPVIFTYHTRLEHYAHYVPLPTSIFRNLIVHSLIRRFANRCHGVIVPTESAEEYLRTIGVKRRILVQPTGIEIEKFNNVSESDVSELKKVYSPNGEKILISISRLSKEKNIDFLLEAIALLKRKKKTSIRLLLIGSGPEYERIQRKIIDRDLQNFITLLGNIAPDDIPVYCKLGDIFLFASRSETQGMVILEAMAAGTPVVAVRSSGIDDIVQNAVNGFKTPCDTDQWCLKISQLLNDDKLYHVTSEGAKATAYSHSIECFSENVSKFYALIDSKSGS